MTTATNDLRNTIITVSRNGAVYAITLGKGTLSVILRICSSMSRAGKRTDPTRGVSDCCWRHGAEHCIFNATKSAACSPPSHFYVANNHLFRAVHKEGTQPDASWATVVSAVEDNSKRFLPTCLGVALPSEIYFFAAIVWKTLSQIFQDTRTFNPLLYKIIWLEVFSLKKFWYCTEALATRQWFLH